MTMDEVQPTIDLKGILNKKKALYAAPLLLALVIVIVSYIAGWTTVVVMDLWLVIIVCIVLFSNRYVMHIPPFFFITIIVAIYLNVIACYLVNNNNNWIAITSIFTGFVLAMIGVVVAYTVLGKKPDTSKDRLGLIAFESFVFAIALYSIGSIVAYYITMAIPTIDEGQIVNNLMARSVCNAVGALITCILFYYGVGKGYLDHAINNFLEKNSKALGLEIDDAELVKKLIDEGESNYLEFKSTLRLNLNTGEKDKRMEKAVLKTLVAFLNTDGGTLLVGVEDNGNILGVDIEGFDNRDKMNLHITNLISSQIGDEFLPYIKFRSVDFGKKETGADKIVIIFECSPTASPVFFKDPKEKQEIYFVRSGPSTIELTGVDLLKYATNRGKKKKIREKKSDPALKSAPVTEEKTEVKEE